jgi:hypothetical protein
MARPKSRMLKIAHDHKVFAEIFAELGRPQSSECSHGLFPAFFPGHFENSHPCSSPPETPATRVDGGWQAYLDTSVTPHTHTHRR